MSRLIIKNLPKSISEEKLRSLFGEKGHITDIQLKYTKEGIFRRFAFIGYQREEEAKTALNYFNNSCIHTNRIKVETCAPLGAEEKPQSWSKYSKDSSAYKKIQGLDKLKEKESKKTKKKNSLNEIFGDHKDDPKFKEFLRVHTKQTSLWDNDADVLETQENSSQNKETSNILNESDKSEVEEQINNISKSNLNEVSDLEYMQFLKKNQKNPEKKSKKKQPIDLYTIKIHDIPYKTKRKDIIKFFKPVKIYSVRVPTKVHGFCYVGLKSEQDFKKAMLKHKSFLKGKQVFFSNFTEKNKVTKNKNDEKQTTLETDENSKWLNQENNLKEEEDISESGRIFFRNLAYTVTEDELSELFTKYGPIAEINLPIDNFTRQIKGFGTVTFVMPEHAVLAFSELDGILFHGRLLHLIPGKSKEIEKVDETSNKLLSFKNQKFLKLKQSANLSHNWNTLFLGSNAVADLLAQQFETSKENILDTSGGGSNAAVRLALGETKIVIEMKRFLEENNVAIEVFDTFPKKRSKTVIIAKNLPADTTVTDIKSLFSKFGLLGRVILPPSGITALIEFFEPSEARKAFKNLAYSKFKNLPLYLEWAPENTFRTTVDKDKITDQKQNVLEKEEPLGYVSKEKTKEKSETAPENQDDETPEEGTTLFLKNLNFKTKEEAVRNHFKHLGAIHTIQIAMRKDPENPKSKISLGYGFIQFRKRKTLENALKTMQLTTIEGNQVELKRSDRTLKVDEKITRKKVQATNQTGSKILVRNIPFQAKVQEVRDIFKAFGEIQSVRLPKKLTPGEDSHRGFGFVDFLTKSDAKKAFDALCQSTHLYGRRLVLEWAAADENNLEELRKRTAEHFSDSGKGVKRSRKSVFDPSKIGDVITNDVEDNL